MTAPHELGHQREQGVDVRAFKPLSFARGIGALIRRDHRKILVVDGEIAFVGGINLAAEWAPRGHGGGWRDDVMKVEGPAALMLERLFCASWRMEAHKRLYRLRRRHAARRQRPARPRGIAADGPVFYLALCPLSLERIP